MMHPSLLMRAQATLGFQCTALQEKHSVLLHIRVAEGCNNTVLILGLQKGKCLYLKIILGTRVAQYP